MLLILSLIFLMSSCSILNGGTVHFKYTNMNAKINNIKYENSKKLSDLSFSVRQLQHPYSHEVWDWNLGISPSIHFDKSKFITSETFINDNEVQERYPDVKLLRLSGLGNLKLSSHTPIGSFVLTAGFGGAFYRLDNGYNLDTLKTREIRKLDFAYIGFFNERFFIMAGPRYYKEAFEQYVFALRFGYFWGEVF
jgi:hypothetical protein